MTVATEDPSHSSFLPLGAIIQTFKSPDRSNLVLNFPNAELYKRYNEPYFGETIGRVANRISGACINNLNGRSYKLAANNGPNCLHGGQIGWGKKEWNSPRDVLRQDGRPATKFSYISEDGEEGFPGKVAAHVWYMQSREEGPNGELVNQLEIEYEAELVGQEEGVDETVIGMTNHTYFNISKSKTIEKTEVTLSTNQHLPVDDTLIPTGSVEPYPNIEPLTPFVLGQHQPDIDHCFIMDPYDEEPDTIPTDTRGRPIRIHASFYHPDSKTHLEVLSTEPAFQFYTGKYIDVPAIKDPNGVILVPSREARAGFCVEPSRYVNAVNKPEWKSMVTVKRGEKFGSRVIYRAWKGK